MTGVNPAEIQGIVTAWLMMGVKLLLLGAVIWASVKVLFGTFFTVEQQTAVTIERWGKFVRVAHKGLNWKVPFIERKARTASLAQETIKVSGDYVTKDRSSVNLTIDILHLINPDKVFDALYRLDNPTHQMGLLVSNVVRAQVATMDIDELFSSQRAIGDKIHDELATQFTGYGYQIVSTPVTDVTPSAKVTAAMNEINAARREQEAATARGEAEKIRIVKAAEAEAERKRLDGQGIAQMAIEVAKGRRQQVEELKAAGMSEDTATAAILFLQYSETLKDAAQSGKSHVIMMPSGPSASMDIMQAIRDSVFLGNQMDKSPAPNGKGH